MNTRKNIVMTLKEYAKYQGVNPSTVTRWKESGYLVLALDGRVNVKESDLRLSEAGHGKSSHKIPLKKSTKKQQRNIRLAFQTLLENEDLLTEAEARRVKENFLAALRRLEYKKKSGTLVEIEPLRKALFDLWRKERNSWQNWPTRISAILAARFGIDQVEFTIELEKLVDEHLKERSETPIIQIPE